MTRLIDALEQVFLPNGLLDFYETGGSTVRKTTYADAEQTIANDNPVVLNGDGRVPNVFGSGVYRVVLRTTAGAQILQRDPVGGDTSLAFGADWISTYPYGISDAVRDDGRYWESSTANNIGNAPSTDGGTSWIELDIRIIGRVETYAQLDAIPVQNTGAVITVTGEGISGQFVVEDGAHTANVGTIRDFTNAVGNQYLRRLDDGALDVKWFGAVGDGVADDSAALIAAIAAASAKNGAEVVCPPGVYALASQIIVDDSNIVITGAGSTLYHDGGTGDTPATKFLWIGGATDAVFRFQTPNSGIGVSKKNGMGMHRAMIDGNSVASRSIIFTSIHSSNFSDLYSYGCLTDHYLLTTYTTTGASEAMDLQQCTFDNLKWRSIDSTALKLCSGLVLQAHANPSTGNVSLNRFTNINGQSWNGSGGASGIVLSDGDNNDFNNCQVYRIGGTVVAGILLIGNTFMDSNRFYGVTSGGTNGIVIQGTASGYSSNPKKCSFMLPDTGNGTQEPVVDAGVTYGWYDDQGVLAGMGYSKAAISDNIADAITQRALITTETLRISNNSQNHVILTTPTASWGMNIDGATGDLRFNRIAGSGSINLGNGAQVKINTKLVTEGAADSGGAGFKLLRIPN
tara:strand:+ start:7274 stop:9157 length:1884 start_codon:yes stop_codon:yes gene_type:complete